MRVAGGAMDAELRYQSYLIKIWRNPAAKQSWRMLVIDVESGRRLGFSRPDDFLAYLRAQMMQMDENDPIRGYV